MFCLSVWISLSHHSTTSYMMIQVTHCLIIAPALHDDTSLIIAPATWWYKSYSLQSHKPNIDRWYHFSLLPWECCSSVRQVVNELLWVKAWFQLSNTFVFKRFIITVFIRWANQPIKHCKNKFYLLIRFGSTCSLFTFIQMMLNVFLIPSS